MNQYYKFFIAALFIYLFTACTAYKKVPYLKNSTNENSTESKIVESKILPKDLLTIVVNTTIPEASSAFNLPLTPNSVIGNTSINSSVGLQSYLVDNDGTISFPILGKIKVVGKTKKEVELFIQSQLYPKYLTEEPIVHVRFINYKIAVLGEVSKPGSFVVNNERVSIFDALAMAGDMTLYGKRTNVLLLRENEKGEKETIRLNLQNKDILNSPYYYLQQNDVVYVEPNKHKANASSISSAETLSISITSTLISLTSLLITVFK
ncbi:MAG: polysaccharide biosynthesis/export family protein [Paludibacteraceae bacterium]|nr:polysaccharide biosynthesis/export family protein [Paludibacteraceae bacterium]MBN2787008.1 polysaccharide biosynthesis/export family protein [Paludibacteraceae bacterium]